MFIIERYGEMFFSTLEWRPIFGSVDPVEALKRYIQEYEALRQGGLRLREVRGGREFGIREAWAPKWDGASTGGQPRRE